MKTRSQSSPGGFDRTSKRQRGIKRREVRQAAAEHERGIKRQEIQPGNVSASSSSSHHPSQTTMNSKSCPASMSKRTNKRNLQSACSGLLSLSKGASAASLEGASLEGAGSLNSGRSKPQHIWTEEEVEFLVQMCVPGATTRDFGRRLSKLLNGKFSPEVEFTEPKIRAKVADIRKIWRGFQHSDDTQSSASTEFKTVLERLVWKYKGAISFEDEGTSSGSKQMQPMVTVDSALKFLLDNDTSMSDVQDCAISLETVKSLQPSFLRLFAVTEDCPLEKKVALRKDLCKHTINRAREAK